jgi:hypothetical protein
VIETRRMANLPQRVKDYWLAHGVKVRPGASAEELEQFERSSGVRLPGEIRAFLQTANGFEAGEWDEVMIEWYPISRWERMTDTSFSSGTFEDASSYYLFADYCLQGLLYAVRLSADPNEPNTVIGWAGEPCGWRIASSFSELLEAYLLNPAVLLG